MIDWPHRLTQAAGADVAGTPVGVAHRLDLHAFGRRRGDKLVVAKEDPGVGSTRRVRREEHEVARARV